MTHYPAESKPHFITNHPYTEKELSRGWNLARTHQFQVQDDILDTLDRSQTALAGYFAAVHCEGGGATRPVGEVMAQELNLIAIKGIHPFDFQGGFFATLIYNALLLSQDKLPVDQALNTIDHYSTLKSLPAAAQIAEACRKKHNRIGIPSHLKQFARLLAQAKASRSSAPSDNSLSICSDDELQAIFLRVMLTGPVTESSFTTSTTRSFKL